MTDPLIRHLPMIGAFALSLALGACAQGGFTDEGADAQPAADEGNFAKSMLISMGAIEDPHAATNAPKFQPRPPLVVPPQKSLPVPVDQDALLANKHFPIDPEIKAEQDRAARLKADGTAGGNGQDKTLTLAEQEKFKDLPQAGAPDRNSAGSSTRYDHGEVLKPWELDGKAQAAALEAAQSSGPAAKEQVLITPPADYRTPSDKAPLESPKEGIAALKPSWWPF